MWGPPVKKWFISPSNYNVINTINHSEIGVICTNLAILGASLCKSSWTHRFFLVQTPLNHRALERWTVGPGPARRLGILQGVGHRLCHGVIPEQLRLAILMGFLWEFFGAWLDSDGISMYFYGFLWDFYGIYRIFMTLNFYESFIESWTIWIRLPYKS